MASPRDYIVNSDYPMDFIVWGGTGNSTSSNYNQTVTTISHGLPFKPLVFGQFSLDNGATWMPMGLYDYFVNKIDIWIESDATNVYVNFTYLASGSKTIQFRIWAFAPADADASVVIPASSSNDYRLNTDFNYSKLVKAGKWTITTGARQTIFSHGLGYTPEVMVWFETSNGRIRDAAAQFSGNTTYWPIQYTQIDNTALYARFTSTAIGSLNYTAVHYRIYGDLNG